MRLSWIRRFYLQGFNENPIHNKWIRLWDKQFKIRTENNRFLKLNKYRSRLNFKTLKRFCIHFAPQNVYMSALNFLMPERLSSKSKANHAYPIGGEYVVDVDSYLFWRPHHHYDEGDGVCYGCLSLAKAASLRIIDKVRENYSDIHIVFSGQDGFHVHVWDFDPTDWTHYDPKNPIKSHEVGRFLYTKHLKAGLGGFNKAHFVLSSDVCRVVTFPESLNARTRLKCSYLGTPSDFVRKPVARIVWDSKVTRFFFNLDWERLNDYAHLELPSCGGDDL